jgi:DNA-binding NarL/FixJ family response regulator
MTEQETSNRQRRTTLRVVIADDTSDIRQVLRSLLDQDGTEIVAEATTGQEAIDAVERFRPDLVVMDYMMPVMGGIEATAEIKRRWPQVEILGYTSAQFEETAEKMLSAGASETFDKLHIDQLVDAVARRIPRSSKRTRLLLVDDDPDVRLMLKIRLEMTDIDVVGEAADGLQAIELMPNLDPDVVIMDLMMPGVDGIEATRTIKAEFPNVRILGYTSFPTHQLMEAGADQSFPKTDTEALVQAVVDFE